MRKVFELIDKVTGGLNVEATKPEILKIYADDIHKLAAVIGDLNVSCCTDTREILFHKILKELDDAHNNIMSAMSLSQ